MALGSLVVQIVGDASQLKTELTAAANSSETFATKARASVNAVGVALGAMGAAAGAALGALVVSGMNSAKEIKNLATLANTTAEEFQAFAYAARSVGVEQDKLSDILKDVNDKVGDFMTTGAGPMADFFERIGPRVGVTAEQFRNLSGPQALGLYVDSLNRANLSQAELTFFMEAIASDSTALLPLLKDNAAGLRAMSEEARRLGVVTSDLDIAKIEAARASLSGSAAVSEAFSRNLATEAAPAIAAVAEGIKDWAMQMGGFDKVARNTIDGIAAGAGFVGDVFRGWSVIIQSNIALLRTLFAEATRGIDYLAKGTAGWRRDFWESVDGLGEKIGIELDLSEQAEQAASSFEQFSAAAVQSANESIEELKKLMEAPLPSDQINARLEEWRKRADDTAAAIVAARKSAEAQPTTATPQAPGAVKFTIQESDTGIEQLRSRLAERAATFEAWRKGQADADQRYGADTSAIYSKIYADRIEQARRALAIDAAQAKAARDGGAISAEEFASKMAEISARQVEGVKRAAAEIAKFSPPPVAIARLESIDPALRAEVERITGTIADFAAVPPTVGAADLMGEFAKYQQDREQQLKAAQAREIALIEDREKRGLLTTQQAQELARQAEADHNAQLIESRAAAAEELRALSGVQPLGIDPLSAEGADTVNAVRERLQEQVDTIAEFNALKLEQLQSQQDQELAILQARRDADLLSVAEFEALKAGIEKEGADARKQTADAERAAKLSIYGSMFDNVAGLMQSGSKKLFNIGKTAAIASGLVSAYEAIMHAYKEGAKIGGPKLGAAYAATAGIAQAANLMRLKSANFGGGSVSTGGGSGGGSGGGVGSTGQAPAAVAPAQPSRNISISLAGSTFSADTVRELISQINEQIGDGATITAG